MKSIFENLEASINCNQEEDIKSQLQCITLHSETLQLSNVELAIIQSLLKHSSIAVLICTTELLAEIAKTSQNRDLLTTNEIVPLLLGLLDYEDCALLIQACRSLGNICYENAKAREIVGKSGLKKLLSLLKHNKLFKNIKLETVCFGFLLNLLVENEELQKEALEDNVLQLLEDALGVQKNELQENCILHLLSILSMIMECTPDNYVPESLCSLLIGFLRNCNNTQIAYYCLEIIHEQAERDNAKLFLAKEGMCELVISLIEKYKDLVDDEETRTALRMACDIIVLILTEDEPMILLYKNGEGSVYTSMLYWINSDDVDLSTTAILAIGNFARNDTHCIQMVRNGISKHLLELLPNHNSSLSNEEIKIQHAILSALRNLVILSGNRAQMIEEGLINKLYPILSSNYTPVIFKLLGTLRIVTDGQEKTALGLIMRRDFLEKIIEFYFHSDHFGVRGEACRLFAWLIKNCHSSKPYNNILDIKDCIKCLSQMILSNHAIMQNEAFFALNLIAVTCLDTNHDRIDSEISLREKFDKALGDADVGESLTFLINKYKDKFEQETVSNLLTLLNNLVQFENVLQHLKNSNIKDSLLSWNEGNCFDMGDKIQLLLHAIDSG